jgi:acetoin:2,6-dichlorophenolindophenol oxidoreductase subunit beta
VSPATATVVVMPRLSDSMEEGTVVRWLKADGDTLAPGDELVEIETDKATMVYQAEAAGTLRRLVAEGDTVGLGAPIAELAAARDGGGASNRRTEARVAPATASARTGPGAPTEPPTPAGASPRGGEAMANATVTPVRTVEFRTAIRDALDEELDRDERVVFFGEDVAKPGGVFAVTPGLQERHGADRVFDTPISELVISGAAFGAAVSGLRPVIEIMFGDFLPIAMDAIVNQSAKYWYLSQKQASVPIVIRSGVGAGGRFGAVHSQNPAGWFIGVPGLKIVAPATVADAKALLKAAIRDDNPVLFLEHKRLYSVKGEAGDEVGEIGRAAVRRNGADITIVASMKAVPDSLEAAEALAREGIDAEVIDLRTLRPLDTDTILASVARTNRVVVVDEGPHTGGVAAEVLAAITENALDDLDDAWRITTPDQPIPYSPTLEDDFLPSAARIVAGIRQRLGG